MIELQPQEKVVFLCRRHWWAFLVAILKTFLMVAVMLVALMAVDQMYPRLSLFSRELFLLILFVVFEVLWIGLFLVIADFYLDVWIVTNERLIFMEIHGLFSRTVNSVDYRNVQDVSASVHGIIATFLKFGDVTIQSAGTHGAFRFHRIPKPNEVKERILLTKNEFLRQAQIR